MGVEAAQPQVTPESLAFNFTNEGGVNGTIRLLKNIMGLWLVQECKREWGLSYDEITRLASQARTFLAVIDPDNPVFLHPGDMPEKIRKFCEDTGQAVPGTQGEIARVALESLALKYRFVLERLEELAGRQLEPLHIIAGGTRNHLLNQSSADATGRTVIAGPVEATAIGNILMQAIALGEIGSLDEARQLVRRSFEIDVHESTDVELRGEHRDAACRLFGVPEGTRVHIALYRERRQPSGKVVLIHFYDRTTGPLAHPMRPGQLGISLISCRCANLDTLSGRFGRAGGHVESVIQHAAVDYGIPCRVMLVRGPSGELFEFTGR